MNINDLANKYESYKQSLVKHSEMQFTDNTELLIEGCRKVIVYDENYIKLELASMGAAVDGLELTMRNFSIGGVVIKGKIRSVTFLDKEEL